MSDDLRLDVVGPVATLLINRPSKRNAITYEMWKQFPALLAEVEARPDIRVLVVRGAGDRAFSAGADISEFQALRASAKGTQTYNDVAARAQDAVGELSKPTIAMVQGVCVGGGCGVALSCDIRVGDSSATFAITPARLGIVYPVNVTKRLVDLVGSAQAKAMLYTGNSVDAAGALRIGLLQELVTEGSADETVAALAATICSRAPYSIHSTKRIIDLIAGGLGAETTETLALRSNAFDTEDYREGVRAFLEKRPARFGSLPDEPPAPVQEPDE